jgi:hypothetical protein
VAVVHHLAWSWSQSKQRNLAMTMDTKKGSMALRVLDDDEHGGDELRLPWQNPLEEAIQRKNIGVLAASSP